MLYVRDQQLNGAEIRDIRGGLEKALLFLLVFDFSQLSMKRVCLQTSHVKQKTTRFAGVGKRFNKKSPFPIIEVSKPLFKKGKVILCRRLIVQLIQNGCASTI